MLATRLIMAKTGSGEDNLTSLTYYDRTLDTGNIGVTRTNTLNIGPEPSAGEKRILYVCAGLAVNNTTFEITSMSCNGNSMTEIVTAKHNPSGLAFSGIYRIEENTGTTASFTLTRTAGSSFTSGGFLVYSLIMSNSATIIDYDTSTDTVSPINLSLDTPNKKSFIIGASACRNGSTSTWSGLTEDEDFDMDSTDFLSSASDEFTTAQTGYSVSSTNNGSPAQFAGCAVTISTQEY